MISKIFIIHFSLLSLFFFSCSDDENSTPIGTAPISPTVQLIQVDTLLVLVKDGDVFEQTQSFNLAFSAVRGDNPMNSWSLKLDGNVYNSKNGLVPDIDNFSLPLFDIPVPMEIGNYTFEVEIIDNAGIIGSTDFEITVVRRSTFSNSVTFSLGAQGSTAPSFYNIDKQTVINTVEPSEIDFFYYFESSNGNSIWSPNDQEARNFNLYGVDSWSVRRSTKMSRTTLNFSDANATDVLNENIVGSRVINLELGDVVLTESSNGTRGILRVISIASGSDGSIEFDAKFVQ